MPPKRNPDEVRNARNERRRRAYALARGEDYQPRRVYTPRNPNLTDAERRAQYNRVRRETRRAQRGGGGEGGGGGGAPRPRQPPRYTWDMSATFVRGTYVPEVGERRLNMNQRNYYTRVPEGGMYTGIRTNNDFANPPQPPPIGLDDLRVTTTVTNALRTRIATVVPNNARNDDRFTQLNRIVANRTRDEALRDLLDDLPNWSSRYVYFFDITMRRLTRNNMRDEGLFTTTLRDGRAPIMCAPHAEQALEAPHLRSQTCVQDLLQRYTQECAGKTTEQITKDIADTWAKHRTDFRTKADFSRVFDVVLSGSNVNHKRDLLASFDYTDLDRIQDNHINGAHLVVWCFYHRVQLSILDFNLNLACRVLPTSQIDKHKKALMVVIAHGHIYSVVGKTMRRQIQNIRENHKVCEKPEDEDPPTFDDISDDCTQPFDPRKHCKMDIINDEDKIIDLILEHSKIVPPPIEERVAGWCDPHKNVQTTCDLHKIIAHTFERHHLLPMHGYIKMEGGSVKSVSICDVHLVHEPDPHQVHRLHMALNDPHYSPGSSLSKVSRLLFNIFDKDKKWQPSCFNDVTKAILDQAIVSPCIYSTYDPSIHTFTASYDVRRCYTSMLLRRKQWLKTSAMNDVRPYSGEIRPDTLYYVETPLNNFLLSGSGLYTDSTLLRAKKAYMITDDDITYELQCQVVPFDFAPFVKHVYDVFTDHDAKDVVNRFIGTFNSKRTTMSKVAYTNDRRQVSMYYHMMNAIGYKKVLECTTKDLYCVHRLDEKPIYTSHAISYIQIIQDARCQMYDLSVQTQTGCVVQCKTDSLTIAYPSAQAMADDVPLQIQASSIANIGSLRESHVCNVLKRTPTHCNERTPYHLIVPDVNVLRDLEGDTLFDLIMGGTGNVFIQGKGGSGKTTLMQRVYAELVRRKIRVVRSSFQHITCERIGDDAKTNHSVFGINVDGTATNPTELKCEVIIMEEISMTPCAFYDHINRIHRMFPSIRIIAFGHFAQLYPVCEENVDIENSHVFKSIFPTQVYLEGRFRSPDEHALHVIQDEVEAGTYDPETLRERINNGRTEPVGADLHLVVSNDVRKKINAKLNKGKKGVLVQAEDKDIYLQSYVLHTGLRVMKVKDDVTAKYIKAPKIRIKKANDDVTDPIKKIHNGSMYEVESFTNNTVTLVRLIDFEKTDTKVVLPFDATKFGYYFTIAWALTVYKAQGCNIDRPHVMHEFHKIKDDKRYVYTSITRTTKQAHLYISRF